MLHVDNITVWNAEGMCAEANGRVETCIIGRGAYICGGGCSVEGGARRGAGGVVWAGGVGGGGASGAFFYD